MRTMDLPHCMECGSADLGPPHLGAKGWSDDPTDFLLCRTCGHVGVPILMSRTLPETAPRPAPIVQGTVLKWSVLGAIAAACAWFFLTR